MKPSVSGTQEEMSLREIEMTVLRMSPALETLGIL